MRSARCRRYQSKPHIFVYDAGASDFAMMGQLAAIWDTLGWINIGPVMCQCPNRT